MTECFFIICLIFASSKTFKINTVVKIKMNPPLFPPQSGVFGAYGEKLAESYRKLSEMDGKKMLNTEMGGF